MRKREEVLEEVQRVRAELVRAVSSADYCGASRAAERINTLHWILSNDRKTLIQCFIDSDSNSTASDGTTNKQRYCGAPRHTGNCRHYCAAKVVEGQRYCEVCFAFLDDVCTIGEEHGPSPDQHNEATSEEVEGNVQED